MRLVALGIGSILFLLAGSALAAPGKVDAAAGKGGSPPATRSGSSGDSGGGTESGRAEARDIMTGQALPEKAWEVEAAYEEHALVVQNQTSERQNYLGYAAAYGRYDVTANDRIQLRLGMYVNHYGDQGESGVRADDFVLSYTRYIHLPADVTARALVWLTAPTSFDSQKASLITAPRLSLGVARTFFKYVDLDARVAGDYYITKYASYAGGAPNAKEHVALAAGLVVTMPFHEPLQLGGSVNTGYTWYYAVGTPPISSTGQLGNVGDAKQSTQAVQQSYGYEVYVRYNFPAVYGVRGDVTLAYANGDPTMGNASVRHDGAVHAYFPGFPTDQQFFGALAVRY
jgi:hypothetical protein